MTTTAIILSILGLGLLLVIVIAIVVFNRRKPDPTAGVPPQRNPIQASQEPHQSQGVGPLSVGPGSSSLGPPQFEVVCIQGNQNGAPRTNDRYPITPTRGWILIGRDGNHDISINGDGSNLVSSNHASILVQNGQIFINDLESTNGTWIEGNRLSGGTPYQLKSGQPFQIGPCIFVVVPYGQLQGGSFTSLNEPPPSVSVHRSIKERDVQEIADDLGLTPIGLIGEGGAAIVYECKDQQGNSYALKVVNQKADQYFKDKFHQEIQVAQILRHPNIVTVHSSGYSPGNSIPYILMEFMDGGSLKDYMDRSPHISIPDMVNIVGQLCLGLYHAHQNKIYHRDIKPENILFNTRNEVKVADFGIAKLTENAAITRDGVLVGTPHYMSFEQAKARAIDHRSDQYSVGIVMYQMLTGRVPFDGNPLDIVGKHANERPLSLRYFNQQIPEQVDSIVLRTLEKDKMRRYASMIELAQALGYRNTIAQGAYANQQQLSKRAMLQGIQGHSNGEIIELDQGGTEIGRGLFVNQPNFVSNKHAQIYLYENDFVVRDLQSANGTYINGHRIQAPTRLAHGCYVSFGPLTMIYLDQ